jgi:5S rRNA maturation endonuclease (ribonuclease M5)
MSDEWVRCSREDYAGNAKYSERSRTYAHRLRGPCPCGVEHAPGDSPRASGARRKRPIDRIYQYRDAEGRVVFEVVRFKDPKDFRQRRPIGDGRYAWNLEGIEPILYRLTELLAASKEEVVWICEGEKDADRLASLGQVATCNPMGAGKWRDHYAAPLEGRRVIILPDNDEAGRDHARQVAASLAGRAASIKLVELPDLPEKGDVSDFLDAGGTVERLRELADIAPEWFPGEAEPQDFDRFDRFVAGGATGEPPINVPEWPAPPEAAAYRGLPGEIVRVIAPVTEADPVALLVQLLIAFGNLIGRRAYVGVGAARHHTNEFAVMVGETSAGRKGQSWRESRQFVAAADPDWAAARIQGGLSSGEGVIYHVRDPLKGREPIRQKGKIVGYQDVIQDRGVEDKRLLLFEPEFGGVLQALNRDGNKLSAVIRQAWDSETMAILTKSSPHQATGAHVSAIGHITAEELTHLLSACDQANGFANRILWCCVRRSKSLPFGGRPDEGEVRRLQARVGEAAAFARTVEEVAWSPEAIPEWEAAYERLTAPRPGAFGRATSRAEAHALRLSLLYALMDRSDRIEPPHLRAALAVWDYCERSAAYIFGGTLGDRDAEAILDALRGAPAGMTRKEINAAVFHNHRPAYHVTVKLSLLLKMRLVRFERVATGGRPAERWFAAEPSRRSDQSDQSPPPSPEADEEVWVEI